MLRTRRNELFLLAFLMVAGTALVAQMDTGETRSFAYTGYLESNGVPSQEPHDVQFALFTSPSADTSCLQNDPAGACGIWSEVHDAVPMSSGNFSVMLGRGAGDPLTDSVMNSNTLYLGISVREAGVDPVFSELAGLSELSAVPWAARAAAAKNYSVTGQLTAGSAVIGANMRAGTATIDGALTAASVTATNSLTTNTLSAGAISGSTLTTSGDIRSTSLNGKLGVSTDKVLSDNVGDEWLRLYTGYSSSTYASFAAGKLYAAGELYAYNNTWDSTTTLGETTFANNGTINIQYCTTGQYVCGVGLGHTAGNTNYWTGARLQLACCRL